MSKKLQAVRGTVDLFGEDFAKHEFIRQIAYNCALAYGFEGGSTPVFEATDVFKRTLGDTSDVVQKEMYSFESKGGDNLTLRPEFTAGIVRAFISNGMQQNLPLKVFSTGPLFRYERPQKGRQRQFHQINFEWLGGKDYYADVQLIALASQILNRLEISQYTLELNTLGDDESRDNYRKALVDYLQDYKDKLSEDSLTRLQLNPLRILDSKDEGDKAIVAGAPKTIDYLSDNSREIFENVCQGLNGLGIAYHINPKIVRGLDYYNDVVFEFISDDERIGSQSTILAGGRYDRLVEQMGGGQTPAVGFAAGIERLALLLDADLPKADLVAILPDNDSENGRAIEIATKLRNENIATELFMGGNFGKRMKKANNKGAVAIITLREDESPVIKADDKLTQQIKNILG